MHVPACTVPYGALQYTCKTRPSFPLAHARSLRPVASSTRRDRPLGFKFNPNNRLVPCVSCYTRTSAVCFMHHGVLSGRPTSRPGYLDLPSHALPRVCTCLSRTVLRVAVSSQSRIRSRSAMYGLHSVDWSINDTFMLHASPINRRGLRMPGRLPRGSRVSKAWAARSWPPASRRARGVTLRVGLVCSGRCGGS